jgi:hypothetical protein
VALSALAEEQSTQRSFPHLSCAGVPVQVSSKGSRNSSFKNTDLLAMSKEDLHVNQRRPSHLSAIDWVRINRTQDWKISGSPFASATVAVPI